MKKILYLAFLLATGMTVFAQDSITARIVLIGDAGELTNGKHPVVDAVRRLIPLDAKTTVLYLGDNLYKTGLPDDQLAQYIQAKAVLDTQLSIADGTPVKVYMIPGNHDWENGGRGGYDAVLREQSYVDQLGKKNVKFYPEGGCPGPVEITVSDDVTIILFDSQWWLHPFDKPEVESDCPYKTKDEVITQLDDLFAKNSKKLVLLACHHTFRSSGVHGGYFTLKQHIFPFTDIMPNLYIPLPVIGSIYPISRSIFGSPQDLKHPLYADMITEVEKVAKKYHNIIFTAGHEHSLQLIKDSSFNYIVSGGASKQNRVSENRHTPFATNIHGFSVVEVSKNKNVRVTFYTVEDSVKMAYTEVIKNFAELPISKSDSSTRKVEDQASIKYKDTINISASDRYANPTGIQKLMVGENYRKEWSTPVNMKVFNIHTVKGGLKIESLGGGKQTKSLTLIDSKGKEWKLRSVDKDPANAIPEAFRYTLASDVVQDFISASHPYAPLTVVPMERALGIISATPELFFVPDDPSFGIYRKLFANSVCMLEEKDPSEFGEETRSTSKVFNKLTEENDHRADQLAVLRARLLDIMIGDFDRHPDQFKWGQSDTGKGKLYYPVPKDRDQAYFNSDGLIIKYASRQALRMLKGFKKNIVDVNWLNWSGREFDHFFLTDLDANEWRESIADFQKTISDSIIARSIKQLPPEVYKMDSAVMTSKLINRRNILTVHGMKYYRFLAKQVNVVGSNQKEYFKITNAPGGLQVRVYARSEKTDTNFVMYDRIFSFPETREIRLYGLNGDDKFDIDSTASSRIKLRVIGGKGNDTFDIRGSIQNFIYDMNVEGNYISHRTARTRNMFSAEPSVNYSNVFDYQYDINRFPKLNLGYNVEDGFFVGVGFLRRTFGFRNTPYASEQRFSTLYALSRKAYQIKYYGEFNHFFRNNDLLLRLDYINPTLNNFFGLGNNTKRDPALGIRFYRTRYKYAEGEVLFRKRIYERLHLMAGPIATHYWIDPKDNAGRILGKPSLIGLDSMNVYAMKTYVGAKLAAYFDNLNNELYPTRGVQWNNQFTWQANVSKAGHPFTKLESDMSVYASLSQSANFIAVIRLGGGHIFSKTFDYFQALNLGANNFLRGFRKTRFSGSSLAYNSVEARIKILDVKSYLFPGVLGVVVFNDVGRVWMRGETSHKWHDAYGGGLYFIPFKLVIVSATVAFSSEERLFNFSAGTRINLTF